MGYMMGRENGNAPGVSDPSLKTLGFLLLGNKNVNIRVVTVNVWPVPHIRLVGFWPNIYIKIPIFSKRDNPLSVSFKNLLKCLVSRTQLRLCQRIQGFVRCLNNIMGVLQGLVDMEDSRKDLSLFPVVFKCINGRTSLSDIKGVVAFMELDNTAVMQGHRLSCPFLILRGNFLSFGDEIKGA